MFGNYYILIRGVRDMEPSGQGKGPAYRGGGKSVENKGHGGKRRIITRRRYGYEGG